MREARGFRPNSLVNVPGLISSNRRDSISSLAGAGTLTRWRKSGWIPLFFAWFTHGFFNTPVLTFTIDLPTLDNHPFFLT
ncbi:MAG: hypothetical protein V7K77_22765 [Nostoc sp.]|uniref:hypothetical protein n=1 Tax=Nostoc sp. TaxID=1180 RepID=UPI002FF60C3D